MDKDRVKFADSNGRSAALELCCFCRNVTDLTQTPGEVVQTILSSAQTIDGWKILTSPGSEKTHQKMQNPPQ